MRLFPADFVPGLSVAPPEMSRPWVIPSYLPRRHKDRLWSLLVAGLHRFDDRLHFVELRWSERHDVQEGRIRLPRPLVARLRGETLSTAEPAAIIEFANRWTPGTPVFDFDNVPSLVSLGWLGPFKVRVLYCIMDVLLDRPPIEETQPIVDVLQEAARLLLTPIELLDFAELMLERVEFGMSIESARAVAFGDALAARFETIFASDVITRVLAEAAGSGLSEPAKKALVRVGLMDGSTPVPLLDLVRDPEIRQRATEAFSRRMDEARWEEQPFEEKPGVPSRAIEQPIKDVELAIDKVAVASPIVRDALVRMHEGKIDAATKLLTDALREGTASHFSREDAAAAGQMLQHVARDLHAANDYSIEPERIRHSHRAFDLCDTAARYFRRAGANQETVDALLLGAKAARRANEPQLALSLLTQAQGLAPVGTNPRLDAEMRRALGDLQWEKRNFEDAKIEYQQAVQLMRTAGDRTAEAGTRRSLARLSLHMLDLELAKNEFQAALDLYRAPVHDGPAVAAMREFLGMVFFYLAEFDQASQSLKNSWSDYEHLDDFGGQARVDRLLGDIHLRKGNLDGARASYTRAAFYGKPFVIKSIADLALYEGNGAAAVSAYEETLHQIRFFAYPDDRWEPRLLRAIAKAKFISNEPALDELTASDQISTEIHDIHGIWLSKSLRAATSPTEKALPLLAECADFFQLKGLPWETCILRGLIALFRDEPAEHMQTIVQPMLGTRAEVIASLVKAKRTKDAHHALLLELPTS